MHSASLLLVVFLFVAVATSLPYQSYRTYRSPLRDGTFDHSSMFRFTDGGNAANLPRFGYGFRDYPYAPIQYGAASSPIPPSAVSKRRFSAEENVSNLF